MKKVFWPVPRSFLSYFSLMGTVVFEPYFVTIFTSVRSKDTEGYDEMDKATFDRVESMPGYMGAESFYNDSGRRVTIVKFRTEEDIHRWRQEPLHREAQEMGRRKWYDHYNIKICKVEREYEFTRK